MKSKNYYKIPGPAVISFSGGRTSGYMLYHILRAYDFQMPNDVYVVFSDTGKEHPGTYDFVKTCSEHWDIEIHTVIAPSSWTDRSGTVHERETPFDALIDRKQYLPNPITRFCTTELKIEPMRKFMMDRGYEFWKNAVGIRADEPARVKKRALDCDKNFENFLPLALAGVNLKDVREFWRERNFDLEVPPGCGNCVGCFMKHRDTLVSVEQRFPGSLDWWSEKEANLSKDKGKGVFWKSPKLRDSYLKIQDFSDRQGRFEIFDPVEESIDCTCTD